MKTLLLLIISTSLFAQSQSTISLTKEDKLRFLDSLNTYRKLVGSPESQYSFIYEKISTTRINTIRKYLKKISRKKCEANPRKYLHYNFDKDFNIFKLEEFKKDTTIGWHGECTYASFTNSFNKKDLVAELFNSWKSSKDHWNNMLDPDFKYITLELEFKDNLVIAVLNSFDFKLKKKK